MKWNSSFGCRFLSLYKLHPTTDVVQPVSRNFRKLILKGPLRRSVVFFTIDDSYSLGEVVFNYFLLYYRNNFSFVFTDLIFCLVSVSQDTSFFGLISKRPGSSLSSYVCWTNVILFWVAFLLIISTGFFLTLEAPTPQNGQTLSNKLSAIADKLFECVRQFCGVGA